MSEHEELHALVQLLAKAERTSPFSFTTGTKLVDAPAEGGTPMYLIHGVSKDGEVRYSAGPYTARVATERVRQMLHVTVGD